MDCPRCGTTEEERYRNERYPMPDTRAAYDEALQQAYQAGAEFGRLSAKLAMRERTLRAYRLGKLRGMRYVLGYLKEFGNRPPLPVHPLERD